MDSEASHSTIKSETFKTGANGLEISLTNCQISETWTIQLEILRGESNGMEIPGPKFGFTHIPCKTVLFSKNARKIIHYWKFAEIQMRLFHQMESTQYFPSGQGSDQKLSNFFSCKIGKSHLGENEF